MSASRRQLIRRGLAVAVAAPLVVRVSGAAAQAEGDAAILETLTGLEQLGVFAYQAAIDSGVLDKKTTQMAELFRDHEQQHADALGAALEALGGARPAKPADAREADATLGELGIQGSVGASASQSAWAAFAIELETTAVAAYHDAHQKLQDAKLLQTATSIMANEGQHLVVLRQLAGSAAVPRSFETGQSGR